MSDESHGPRSNGHSTGSCPTRLPYLVVDRTMSTQSSLPLSAQAAKAGTDPCELAEAAMPDLVFGDLTPDDEDWVRVHTLNCNYCANLLHGFESVCNSLDACNDEMCQQLAESRPPAPIALGLPEARYGFMETPVGDVLVAASDAGVCEINYLVNHDRFEALRDLERRGFLVYEKPAAVRPAIDQLDEYFRHERTDFTLPVDLGGVTPFTRDVLVAASEIPYGKVQTYGDVATAIGKPRASRAVGNALGRNPIPVVIPCHRVVLSSGAMGWYTGGAEIKRTLLGIEGVRYTSMPDTATQETLFPNQALASSGSQG